MNASDEMPASTRSRGSLWQRLIFPPLVRQLKQGITPETIALTLAVGVSLSVFPIFGTTTLLCAIAAALLRLNQPIIQAINYAAYPFQLLLLIPFFRAGERLLGLPFVPLDMSVLVARFHADAGQFFRDFGMTALGAVLVWLAAAPVAIALIYFLAKPVLRKIAKRIQRPPAGAGNPQHSAAGR